MQIDAWTGPLIRDCVTRFRSDAEQLDFLSFHVRRTERGTLPTQFHGLTLNRRSRDREATNSSHFTFVQSADTKTDTGSTSRLCVACYGELGSSASSLFCTLECKSLSKVFTRRLERVVVSSSLDADILNIEEEDSQSFVNLLHNAQYSARFKIHRRKIHRLLVKLSLKHDILPGQLFLRGVKYSGEECHGSGSFADIYLGELYGTKVALKRLRMFQMLDESKRTQLKRAFHHESLIWRGLDHPHVLAFLGVDNTVFQRSPCMVLPWMDLGNIRQASTQLKRCLSAAELIAQTLTWIHEITLGLAYLHTEGVVHGDLRGPNILIDSDRTVKLTDFGLAVFAEGASRNYGSTRGGNARWLAPELIYPELFGLTSDRPTCASDVFALGCVCVELCTFQAPYSGVNDNQVIGRVPQGLRPERPRFTDGTDIPDALWSTITLCWKKEASHRPTALALVEATRSLMTLRELTPPYFDTKECSDTASTDDVIGISTREDGSKVGGDSKLVPFTSMAERPLAVGQSWSVARKTEERPTGPVGRQKNTRSFAHDHPFASIYLSPYTSPSASPPPSASASEKRCKGPTAWKCPKLGCDSTFSRQLHLKYHMRSHTDERPYKCSWAGCKKSFAKEHNRIRHEESHRPDLVTCDGCRRCFLTVDFLNSHLQSDAGAECKKYNDALVTLSEPAIGDDQSRK